MTGETRASEHPQPLVSFEEIRRKMAPFIETLTTRETPDISEIPDLLECEPDVFNGLSCAEAAQDVFEENKSGYVSLIKGRVLTSIGAEYPAPDEENIKLETPKQYCKKNGLDGTMRPALREAQATTIAESKGRLSDRIKNDDEHQDHTVGISASRLRVDAEELYAERVASVRSTIATIKTLMPIKMELAYERTEIARQMLEDAGDHPDRTVSFVHMPVDRAEAAQVYETFSKLKSGLKQLKKGEAPIIGQIVARHEEAAITNLANQLGPHYKQLVREELVALSEALPAAYSAVSRAGTTYRPKAPDIEVDEEDLGTITQSDKQPESQKPEANESSLSIDTISLGNVRVNLPWASGDNFEVSLMKQNGNNLLVIERAMSPQAEKLSTRLRKLEHNANKQLDEMWSRVKHIELSDPNVPHQNFTKVKDVRSEDFDGLIVIGHRAHDTRRIYYVKTSANQFWPLKDLAADNGLRANTALVILVSETDKTNQDETFTKEFGIPKSQITKQRS